MFVYIKALEIRLGLNEALIACVCLRPSYFVCERAGSMFDLLDMLCVFWSLRPPPRLPPASSYLRSCVRARGHRWVLCGRAILEASVITARPRKRQQRQRRQHHRLYRHESRAGRLQHRRHRQRRKKARITSSSGGVREKGAPQLEEEEGRGGQEGSSPSLRWRS